jgi:hypothetical protein
MNDLRKKTLTKRAAELNVASPEERQRILDEIETEIRKELRRQLEGLNHGDVLH